MKFKIGIYLLFWGGLALGQVNKLVVESSIISSGNCPSEEKIARDEVRFKPSATNSNIRITPCDATKNNSVRLKTDYRITSNLESTVYQGQLTGNDSYKAQISQPTAINKNGQVTYLSGQANVSPGGSASYSIGIDIPSGPLGIKPEVSISYNSQGGNGTLGWGWELGGISAITRAATPYYLNSLTRAVDLTDSDMFALNGSKLLVTSGTYGADNSIYRTETENYTDVKYIKSSIENSYFTITSSQGSVTEFGKEGNSKTYPINGEDNYAIPYSWNISKVSDPNGNQVKYTYINTNGAARISLIEYGVGSGATQIQFKYSTRADISDINITEAANTKPINIRQSDVLMGIDIKIDSKLYTSYEFQYFYEEGKTKLQTIQQKDSQGNAINPTEVIWNTSTKTFTTENILDINGAGVENVNYGHFNADKLMDITFIKGNNLFVYTQNQNGTYTLAGSKEVSYTNSVSSNNTVPVSAARTKTTYNTQKHGFSYNRPSGAPNISLTNHSGETGWLYNPAVQFTNTARAAFATETSIYYETWISYGFGLTIYAPSEIEVGNISSVSSYSCTPSSTNIENTKTDNSSKFLQLQLTDNDYNGINEIVIYSHNNQSVTAYNYSYWNSGSSNNNCNTNKNQKSYTNNSVYNLTQYTLANFLNNTDGTILKSYSDAANNEEVRTYSSMVYDDFNGDGKRELLFFVKGVLQYQSSPILITPYSIPNIPKNVFSLDMDGDGKAELLGQTGGESFPDIVVGKETKYRDSNNAEQIYKQYSVNQNANTGKILTYKYNESAKTFTSATNTLENNSAGNIKPLFGDLNGDGKVDIVNFEKIENTETIYHFQIIGTFFDGTTTRTSQVIVGYPSEMPANFINYKTYTYSTSMGPRHYYEFKEQNGAINRTYLYYEYGKIDYRFLKARGITSIDFYYPADANKNSQYTGDIPPSAPHYINHYDYKYNTYLSNGKKLYPNKSFNSDISTSFNGGYISARIYLDASGFIMANPERFYTFTDHIENNYNGITDFNGDGLSDLFNIEKNGNSQRVNFSINTRNGFTQYYQDYPRSDFNHASITPVDYNGDGRMDISVINKTTNKLQIIYFDKDSKENFVKEISDGLGRKVAFEIEPIKPRSTFYTNDLSANNNTYQTQDLRTPMFVCTKLKQPDGIGGISEINYKYGGAVFQTSGKGFLGFKTFEAYNTLNNNRQVSTSTLYTAFGIGGLALLNSKQTMFHGDTTRLNESITEYNESFAIGTKRYFYGASKVTSYDYVSQVSTEKTSIYNRATGEITTSNVKNLVTNDVASETYTFETTNNRRHLKKHETSVKIGTADAITHTTDYEYGTNGLVSKSTFDLGTTQAIVSNFTAYDTFGNLLASNKVADGKTYTTSATYDPSGRFMLTETKHGGYTSSYTYDPLMGTVLTATDPFNNTITTQYDALGVPTRTTDKAGNTSTSVMEWNPTSDGTYLYKVRKNTTGETETITYYDILERGIKTETQIFTGINQTPATLVATKSFNNQGLITYETRPHLSSEAEAGFKVDYTYYNDGTNRIHTSLDRGFTTTYAYDKLKTTVTDHRGRAFEKTLNAAGLLIQVKDHNNQTVAFSDFHSSGKAKIITINGTELVKMTYDNYGRKTSISDRASGLITYQYDALDRLKSQKDANNKQFDLTYNAEGDLQDKELIGANGYKVTHSYVQSGNAKGKIQTITHNTASDPRTETFNYDSEGRLESHTQTLKAAGQTKTLTTSYTYDNLDRITSRTYPSGITLLYDYDPTTGELIRTKKANGDLIWEITAQNKNGFPTEVKHGNGKTITYTYDNTYDFLKSINYSTGHTYDVTIEAASSNITNRTNWYTSAANKKTESFEYDTQYDRLRFVKEGTTTKMEMRYADNGNITYKSDVGTYIYSTTNPYALASITPIAATGQTEIDLKQYQNITYAAFNKIDAISQDKPIPTNPAQTLTNAFTYGADEQRLTMSQGTTTKIYDDGYDAELDANGNIIREWTYIFGPDGNLNAFVLGGAAPPSGAGGLYYVVCDHLGSPSLIANTTGTVVEKLSFDAWGRRRDADTWVPLAAALPPSGVRGLLSSRGYTFHEHLDQFGLINMNGRMYDPVLARFLQPDPVIQDALNTQNYNAYTYVLNNPLKYTDASGNIFFLVPILIGAAIGAAVNVIGQGIASDWTFKNFDFGSLLVDTFVGAVSGAFSFGVGQAFAGASKLTGLARIGAEIGRAGVHGITQGYTAWMGANLKGQDFTLSNFAVTFATGSLSSLASSGLGAIGNQVSSVGKFSNSLVGNMAFGGLIGGATSAALGGNFWEGFATGAIVSGLNHGLNHAFDGNKQPTIKERIKNHSAINRIKSWWKKNVSGPLWDLEHRIERQQKSGPKVKDPNTNKGQTNDNGDGSNNMNDYGYEDNAVPSGNGKGKIIPQNKINGVKYDSIILDSNVRSKYFYIDGNRRRGKF